MAEEKSKTRRMFFALWPDEAVRKTLTGQFKLTPQYQMKGSKILPSNLHITLHFLGNIEESMVECVDQVAQTIPADSLELVLDEYGYFPRPQVFWLGCSRIPEALTRLHQQLGEVLLSCNYQPESRAFAPHVTLMRKLRNPGQMPTATPIHWPIKNFALIESVPVEHGVQYQVVKEYF